jgi:hypothetical protein
LAVLSERDFWQNVFKSIRFHKERTDAHYDDEYSRAREITVNEVSLPFAAGRSNFLYAAPSH